MSVEDGLILRYSPTTPCWAADKMHRVVPGNFHCELCGCILSKKGRGKDNTQKQKKAEVEKTASMWEQIVAKYGRWCVYCGGIADTKDHLVPQSRGGGNNLQNFRPCCQDCNQAKANLTPFEWLGDELCPEEFRYLVAKVNRIPQRVRDYLSA